ncbi:MAG: hypothetical protein K0U93_08445 [Gammaproteobacteria bacterium]|nr:hypothetical protein [Gammaproteobacteria bacterium]
MTNPRFTLIYDDPAAAAKSLANPGTRAGRAFRGLVAGAMDVLGLGSTVDSAHRRPALVFPGAFNPIHHGHEAMAAHAMARLQAPVLFELSIANVDKPPLAAEHAATRCQLFNEKNILLTNAPTFIEKSKLFPGATFVVGIDTAERIVDPRYYDGETARDAALAGLEAAKTQFLVFGRRDGDHFKTLQSIVMPPLMRNLCVEVAESEFRADISSTQVRATKDDSLS